MKEINKKITPLSVVSLAAVLIPWTILYVRTYEFALLSPWVEIIIGIYCGLILLLFAFVLYVYAGKKQRDILAALAVTIHGIYALGTLVLVGISLPNWLS